MCGVLLGVLHRVVDEVEEDVGHVDAVEHQVGVGPSGPAHFGPLLVRRMAMFLTTFFTKSCRLSGCMYSRMAPDSDKLARNTFCTRTPRRLFSSRIRLR